MRIPRKTCFVGAPRYAVPSRPTVSARAFAVFPKRVWRFHSRLFPLDTCCGSRPTPRSHGCLCVPVVTRFGRFPTDFRGSGGAGSSDETSEQKMRTRSVSLLLAKGPSPPTISDTRSACSWGFTVCAARPTPLLHPYDILAMRRTRRIAAHKRC